jgi:hypothetical protein
MSFIKKENLVISIGEYEKNGETKQEYKTIGEIITMQGNDGPYQFFKIWGAGGVTEGKVFAPRDNTQQQQAPAQQAYAQPTGQQQQAPAQQFQQNNGGWPQ